MGYVSVDGGILPVNRIELGNNVNEFTAQFVNNRFTISSPITGTSKIFTFDNYFTSGIFSGNINRDDINFYRRTLFENSIALNFNRVDITDTQHFQLVLAVPFGKNYFSFYVWTQDGHTFSLYCTVTQRLLPKVHINDEFYIFADFRNSITIYRNIGHIEEPHLFVGKFSASGTNYICFFECHDMSSFEDYDDSICPIAINNLSVTSLPESAVYEEIGEPEIVPDNPYPPDSTPDSGEYEPDPTEPTGEPDLPDIGISNIGLVNIYKINTGELNGFASELFPSFNLPTPSEEEGLEGIKENIENVVETVGNFATAFVNNGLVNYVMDCHIVPLSPSVGSRENIKVGFKSFSQTAQRVTSDYVEFNCGSVNVKRVYSNFLDYVGARIKMYLPFIGFVDVNPSWCMGGTLKVKYHFNLIDGSCIAYVIGSPSLPKNENTINNTVVATFGGNCCVHIPITGLNYSSMISGVVSGVGALTSNLSSGNLVGAVNDTFSTISAKPSIQSSNGYNSGMAFMSYRKPFILVERPVASFSDKYPSECGIPSNVTRKLSDIKGYTEIENIVFSNSNIEREEEELIRDALKQGTIF